MTDGRLIYSYPNGMSATSDGFSVGAYALAGPGSGERSPEQGLGRRADSPRR